MTFDFHYCHQAEKFIEANSRRATLDDWERSMASAIRNIRRLEDNSTDVIRMKGKEWKGYWRVRIGGMRAIFRFEGHDPIDVFIDRIEFRGQAYRRN